MPQTTSKNNNTNLDIDKCNDNTNLQPARLNKVSTSVNTNHSVGNQDVNMDTSSSGNWSQAQSKKNKGKRGFSSSSSEPSSPKLQPNNKKLFFSSNRYEVLSQVEPEPTTPSKPTPSIISNESNPAGNINVGIKSTLPPPIFVKGVCNFPDLCTELIEQIGVDNFSCKSSTDRLKIMTANPTAYRTLIHFLKEHKAEYHTYQLKDDKPTRVVIRNLHPTTSTELIKSELESRLFEVRQVTNVLHKINKNPLPLFFVDLEPTIQSNDIYNLTSLIHTKIKVEEPYKSKTISQCINCQEYGHTKSYCGYPARCVRCGALHSSSACPNPRDAAPRCALCSGDHPSNYKGCSVYKDLQQRNKPKKSNLLSDNTSHKKNVQVSQPVVTPSTHLPDLFQTYAQATSGSNHNNSIPPPVSDINKFLDEFKLLINPLIALLTQVISKLLEKN
ncbi:unnamed protein product [Aphis gossypii]|uniref:Pre-C2HC domain-containing protein n=1 Tax=Aphis gossypii TaxID=80765 RepID=A0A9P0INV6_APHGO|nr:unnamed protein product [Aphis gossypii]